MLAHGWQTIPEKGVVRSREPFTTMVHILKQAYLNAFAVVRVIDELPSEAIQTAAEK